MENNKKQPALLYLDANGFYFFEIGLTSVISLGFSQQAVRDMDVISTVALEGQIKQFIEQYQLQPATITIVLSPHITFEKLLKDVKPEDIETVTKKFVDTIPFDTEYHKTYTTPEGQMVIGFNAEMYTSLKSAFEKNSFTVDTVVPYQALGADQSLIQNLTADNAAAFLRHTDRIKNNSILSIEKKREIAKAETPNSQQASSEKPKTNTIRLIGMGVVFVILIVILIVMFLNM